MKYLGIPSSGRGAVPKMAAKAYADGADAPVRIGAHNVRPGASVLHRAAS
jgi:hypothetical protein